MKKWMTMALAALMLMSLLTACGSKSNGVQMGSLSEFDSLSYALGANVATGFSYQLRDVPFDWKAVETAMIESATGKSSFEKHSESVEKLREFFMTKRGERARAIAEKRAAADSARLAGGDTTKVEYPVADPEMFESEEERTEISQALGNDLGYGISQSEMPLQLVWIAQAMQDVRDGNAKMDEIGGEPLHAALHDGDAPGRERRRIEGLAGEEGQEVRCEDDRVGSGLQDREGR